MQLSIIFQPEVRVYPYTWHGYQPGPDWDILIDLQDRFLDGAPFSEHDSQIWKDFQFAPEGWKYDDNGNLYKI